MSLLLGLFPEVAVRLTLMHEVVLPLGDNLEEGKQHLEV
jgi:hypothetical protein